MKNDHNDSRIDTTLGDLVEAVSEVAFEHSQSAEEAYALAAAVLVDLLKAGGKDRGMCDAPPPKNIYLH